MIGKLNKISKDVLKQMKSYKLADLLELTYAYERKDNNFFNKTLFAEFVDCRSIDNPQEILDMVGQRLEQILDELVSYQESFPNLPAPTWGDKIFLHWTEYARDILRTIQWGLPFELEKSGYDIQLTTEEKQQRILAIQEIENVWFGPQVREKTFEVSRAVAHLKQALLEHGKVLDENEKQLMASYIQQASELKSYHPDLEETEELETIMDDDPVFQVEIPREIYTQVFAYALDFYGLQIPVVVDERSSIYDGWSSLHIPDHAGYETLTLQRIIELIQHEIETHYIIQANTLALLGDVRGGSNLLREEGLAKFNEEVINGASLASFDISPSIVEILMGEILEGDGFVEFMYVYRKLIGNSDKAAGYMLRRKRNYPLDMTGVQHKDTSYSRGRFAVRSYLMNGGSYASLYMAKVSFDDMDVLDHSLKDSERRKLLMPQFLAERILYHFLFKDSQDVGFGRYMEAKWPFLDVTKYDKPLSQYQNDRLKQIIELLS